VKSRYALGFPKANIVSGSHKIDPARVGKFDEASQFNSLIAPDTGIGCCAFEIAGNKIVDNAGSKGASGVDDLMRNLQCLRYISGDADLAAPPFFPALRGRDCFIFVLPDLKCDAMDVVALANQKRCSDGTVHSSAHSK
jgi:hypothetical protein